MQKKTILRSTLALAALSALSACGGGDGGTGSKPESPHFVKLRGDNQRALVQGFKGDRLAPPAGLRAATAAPGDSLFAEPLVGILVMQPVASRSPAPGLHLSSVPAGTVVQWEPSDAACARPRFVTTLPGAGDTIVNRAVRGTKARTCVIRAVTLQGTQVVEADSFTFTVDAGPASTTYDTGDSPITNSPMVVGLNAVQDQYGNAIPFRIVAADPLQVQGTVVGSVDARTVVYSGPAPGTGYVVPLDLRDSTNTTVGKLRVVILGTGELAYRATGLSVP